MKLSKQLGIIVGTAAAGALVGSTQGEAAIQGLRGATLAAGGLAVINVVKASRLE